MKPDRIILLRHGESQGNINKKVYTSIPDYAVQLSELGRRQARGAGEQLMQLLADGGVRFYVSPYWRTRQTWEIVATRLGAHDVEMQPVYEDPRLREQEWSGDYRTKEEDYAMTEKRRDNYGHFYFRLVGGESCADVYDRISDFLNTLHRDFEKRDFPRNAVIVTHGMTMRLFVMRWFHLRVEAFEQMANPLNCEYYVMERNLQNDRYTFITSPRHHKLGHKFQFPPFNAEKELAVRPC
jgi:broad specificity phosphatase PhoE